MTKSDTDPWLTFLEWDILAAEVAGGGRVYELVLKIRPSGLLAIIKIVRGDGPFIAFAGARGFRSLSREVRDKIRSPSTKWREDKYAKLDRN